jgi:hypothetical protein
LWLFGMAGQDSAGGSPPAEAGQQAVASYSGTTGGGDNIFRGEHQRGQRGASYLPGQNSKEMHHWTCILFLFAPMFCWRLYFVGAYILWTPIFCRCLYFVETYILSTTIFYRCQYFVDAKSKTPRGASGRASSVCLDFYQSFSGLKIRFALISI